jgi:hypothetical protein
MDVLRAAYGRLDECDYGTVKGAWLDAHRLRIGAAALRAAPAETQAVAAALLANVPLSGATPAVRARVCGDRGCSGGGARSCSCGARMVVLYLPPAKPAGVRLARARRSARAGAAGRILLGPRALRYGPACGRTVAAPDHLSPSPRNSARPSEPQACELARRAAAAVLANAHGAAPEEDAQLAARAAALQRSAEDAAAQHERSAAEAATRAAAGAAVFEAAMARPSPNTTAAAAMPRFARSPVPAAAPQRAPLARMSATDADDWASDDDYDPYGGESKPDAAQVLRSTQSALAAAAAPDATTAEFAAASAARRAEYTAAGHAAAGPQRGRTFVKDAL